MSNEIKRILVIFSWFSENSSTAHKDKNRNDYQLVYFSICPCTPLVLTKKKNSNRQVFFSISWFVLQITNNGEKKKTSNMDRYDAMANMSVNIRSPLSCLARIKETDKLITTSLLSLFEDYHHEVDRFFNWMFDPIALFVCAQSSSQFTW